MEGNKKEANKKEHCLSASRVFDSAHYLKGVFQMKNKNALTILLYVFAVLSLAYTCYAAIQAYNTFTSYYSTNLSVVNLILYMITTCYESICFSVLFYALGVFSEMFKKKEEEK